MLVGLMRLVLRVMMLIVIVTRLRIQALVIRVALRLHVHADAIAWLLCNGARCRCGAGRRLEHGWILERLRDSTVVGTVTVILLPLRVRIIRVRHWVALLWALVAGWLGLSSLE